jgi:hypothetical protein
MKIVALICNIILFGFVCWALLRTYPHPEEGGFLEYALLSVLTPILNLVVLFRSGASDGWPGLHMKRKALEEQRKIDGPAEKHDA